MRVVMAPGVGTMLFVYGCHMLLRLVLAVLFVALVCAYRTEQIVPFICPLAIAIVLDAIVLVNEQDDQVQGEPHMAETHGHNTS